MRKIYLTIIVLFIIFVKPIDNKLTAIAHEYRSRQPPPIELKAKIPKINDNTSVRDEVMSIIDGTDITENDVVWLARVAYSETKHDKEAFFIMWIVKNRVDTVYRGKRTYKDVILDPYQFSAFNPTNSPKKLKLKNTYLKMGFDSKSAKFRKYLKMAAQISTSNDDRNPYLTKQVRHFVHEHTLQSVPNWLPDHPDWKVNQLSIYNGV